MPSVTINEGILPSTDTSPLAIPHAVDATTAAANAHGNDQPCVAIKTPSTPELIANKDPTERSIPPAISTKVIPTAKKVRSGT